MNKKALMAAALSVAVSMGSTVPVLAAPVAATTVDAQGIASSVELSKADKAILMDLFDAEYYAARYPDVVKALGNSKEALFEHFLKHGLAEGRQLNKDFNVNAYRSVYADLNIAFGKNVMAYYKHYIEHGMKENRNLLTVELAQKSGYIVTTFEGDHIAVNEKGEVLRGVSADKFIATSPVYAKAIDNIGSGVAAIKAAVGTVSPAASSSTVEDSKKSDDAQELRDRIAQFNAKHDTWKKAEPQKENYLTEEYENAMMEWEAEKPLARDYVFSGGKYDSKQEADDAFNQAMIMWEGERPEFTEDSYDKAAYDKAVSDWEKKEPNVEDFGLREIVLDEEGEIFWLVLKDAVDESVAVTVTLNQGYIELEGSYFDVVVEQDSAYIIVNEELNVGFTKAQNGTFYVTEAADLEDATDLLLKEGFAKSNDKYYATEAADEADAYTISHPLKQGYSKTGNTYYESGEVTFEEGGERILEEGYAKTSEGTYYRTQSVVMDEAYELQLGEDYAVQDGIFFKNNETMTAEQYEQLSNEEKTLWYVADAEHGQIFKIVNASDDGVIVDKQIKSGYVEVEGVAYRTSDEEHASHVEAKEGYIIVEGSFYKVAEEEDATTENKDLNQGFIEVDGVAYAEATQEDATVRTTKTGYVKVDDTYHAVATAEAAIKTEASRTLKQGYTEIEGEAFKNVTKEEATTSQVKQGYISVETEDGTIFYKDASEDETKDFNDEYDKWWNEEPYEYEYATQEYKDAYKTWMDGMPDIEDYDYNNGAFTSQEQADKALQDANDAWEEERPAVNDFLDAEAFNAAHKAWEKAEPKLN